MEWKTFIAKLKEKKPDKTGWTILILLGVLLLVIALPTGDKNTQQTQSGETSETTKTQTSASESEQEAELETILSRIEGVGKVRVMITYKDSGTQVVEKDTNTSVNNTTEEDSSGGNRKSAESQKEETTVYDSGSSSSGEPFVSKELTPEIEGILVVAEGGGSAVVKTNISDAVLALFPIEAHKIVVVKMNVQEGGN